MSLHEDYNLPDDEEERAIRRALPAGILLAALIFGLLLGVNALR